MTNREHLLQSNEYDLLCKMNDRLLQAVYHDERACIMTALGEPNRNFRCHQYHPNCAECVGAWMNEEVRP